MRKPKVLLLFSGGLDSLLAGKILESQRTEVVGLFFRTYFLESKQAEESAKKINLKLKIVDISKEHLEIVKKPKFGYGRSMNPCLDCRILMLKKAKEILEKEKFDFLATGEVLGERPMTQNKKAFELVEKEAKVEGLVLRPLSAKLLPETTPERIGLIKRENLYDFSGRLRKRQFDLSKKFGFKNFPQPAGGCLLTDLEFGKRLKNLFRRTKNISGNDIELLKIGRHFWQNSIDIVVGRNEKENKKMEKLLRKGDLLIFMKNYPGANILVRNYSSRKIPEEILEKGKNLITRYSKKAQRKKDVEFSRLEAIGMEAIGS